ncbi:MAG: cytochrome P450 [Myxococcota bacterium]|nr:cytochrome P450 [Myxococcota bacterium]
MDIDVAYTESPTWNEADMLERFAWLREKDPVRWSEVDQLWLISNFEDVSYVSKHQETFTSAEGVRPTIPVKIGLIDEEEPRHGELRTLINRGFTPRMVKKLEETFRYLTTKAIDAVARDGQCDFVQSISVPLPLWIIAAMLGIPEEDYDQFHSWSDAMIGAEGNLDNPEIAAAGGRAYVAYGNYVRPILDDRRKNPQDDLASILVGAKDDGLLMRYEENRWPDGRPIHITDEQVELGNDELIKLMVILLVAGNETTRNSISGGMQLLIENPGERKKLIENPDLIKGACEEMIRLVSPVRSFSRTVVHDTELRGRKLLAGQKVLMLYGSANRDPAEFEDPDSFRVDRNPSHLGFGIGSHFCLGANLARMEMRVVFQEVLRRLPDIEYLAGGPTLRPNALVRTCESMLVRYTPQDRVEDAA